MIYKSLGEAAKYLHVRRQAIFYAIQKGKLRAERSPTTGCWVIDEKDSNEWRKNKYSRYSRKFEGKKIFDIENDRWGVIEFSKLSKKLIGRHLTEQHIYYLIRLGRLRISRYGRNIVITREAMEKLFVDEIAQNNQQMNFA